MRIASQTALALGGAPSFTVVKIASGVISEPIRIAHRCELARAFANSGQSAAISSQESRRVVDFIYGEYLTHYFPRDFATAFETQRVSFS